MKMETIVKLGFIALVCIMMSGAASAWTYGTTVDLDDSTITVSGHEVSLMTDMGALDAASDTAPGFTYTVNDTWYDDYHSFYLEELNGISDDPANSLGWFIYDTDDNIMPYGLGNNSITEQGTIKFKYCPYTVDWNTWEVFVDQENATHHLNIYCNVL